MNSTVEITAVFDKGNRTQGNEVLAVTEVRESSGETFLEYHAEVKNLSDREIVLEKVILFHAESFSAYGIEPDYDIFRSGRHKNDMPGVFTTGVKDERLKDLLGGSCHQGKGPLFSFHNYFLLLRGTVPKLLRQHILLTFILRISDPGAPSNSWRRLRHL